MFRPMSKFKIIKSVHFKTTIIVIAYIIISYLILIASAAHSNIFVSFLIPIIFGILSTATFLYLFSHKDFFPFINNLEKRNHQKSQKYLKKFLKFGKFIACVLISLVGGPILLALSVRFLFPKSKNKYQIAIICNIITTLLVVASTKGFLKIIL